MKLWIDGKREPPDGSWTVVRAASEAVKLLEAGGVEEISVDDNLPEPPEPTDPAEAERARRFPHTVKSTSSDVLELILHRLEWDGVMPPTVRVHTDPEHEDVAKTLHREARAIEYRAEYALRFKTRDDWKRFLEESKKAEREAWEKERAQVPKEKWFEHVLSEAEGPERRPVPQFLLKRLKDSRPEMESLLEEVDGHWVSEDRVYRFYHQSFKVFFLNDATRDIVTLLRSVLPHQELNEWFQEIVAEGLSRDWDRERGHQINESWVSYSRPVLEAFFHARWFLGMCIRYSKELEFPPQSLPSGWAGVLYLYNLR